MKRFGIIGIAVLFTAFVFTAAARAQDHDKDATDTHQDAKPEKQQPDHDKAAKPQHDQGKQNKGDADRQDQSKDQEKAAKQQEKDQEKASKQQEHDQQKQEDKNRKNAEKADKHDQQKNDDQHKIDQHANDQRANDQHSNDQHSNDQRQMQPSTPERRVSASDQKNMWQEHRARSWQSEHRTWQQRGGYHGYHISDDRFRSSFGEAHQFVIVNEPVLVVGGFPRFQVAGFWFALVDPWPEFWAANWYQTDDCYIDYSDGGYYLTDVRYPQVRLAINVFVQ